jgi:hypothetical protein
MSLPEHKEDWANKNIGACIWILVEEAKRTKSKLDFVYVIMLGQFAFIMLLFVLLHLKRF